MDDWFNYISLAALIIAVIAVIRSGARGFLARRLSALEERWSIEERELREKIAQLQRAIDGVGASVVIPKSKVLEESAASPLPSAVAPPPIEATPSIPQPQVQAPPPPIEPVASRTPVEPVGTPIPIAPVVRPSTRTPPSGLPSIDWERWLGVRGAAVLGGAVLALAAILFFKYSIEHGLISPTLRVIFGVAVGLGCLIASEAIRRNYTSTSNALAGAGPAVLYASFWAARALYHLIGTAPAFGLMALTTVVCSILAIRYNSLLIALLGLIGGFATPFMLATGADNPIGLFGYVLLLDTGFLVIAIKRRWVVVASLALLGTVLLEAAWIGIRMGPDRLWLGLAILALFALLFGVGLSSSTEVDKSKRQIWLLTQAGGILMPFAISLYIAGRAELGPHFYPLGLLLLFLVTAAGWVAMRNKLQTLATGAATGTVAVVIVWLVLQSQTVSTAWECSVACIVLALVLHLFVERNRESPRSDGPAPAALTINFGLFLALIGASLGSRAIEPWPWVVGWAGLTAMLIRQGTFPGRAWLNWTAAAAIGTALALTLDARLTDQSLPPLALYLAVELAVAVGFQLVALVHGRASSARQPSEHASALISFVFVLQFLPILDQPSISAKVLHLATLLFAVLVVLASTRIPDGRWYCLAAISLATSHTLWAFSRLPPEVDFALIAQGASVLIFSAWPFLLSRVFRSERWVWYGSALSGPAWFLSLKRLFEVQFGSSAIGVLPVVLGGVSLLALIRTRTLWPAGDTVRRSAFVWFAAVAMAFITVAIPLQLEKQWITIGWALEGFAVIVLWKRLNHSGLKYLGLLLLGTVTIRLVFNPWLLEYYPRSGGRVVNWLLYTYWVPVAALLGGAIVLRPEEISRARKWERSLYQFNRPVGAGGLALCAILVFFAWINLAISDWFSTGPYLTISFERLPAKDLTTSISWAIFAVTLLAIGMRLGSTALRWVSLAFLILTIGKVFLYDLGELKDLYRVVSLLGLALSLITVSLAYQRFVFKKEVVARGGT